jgi:hypothetical protein
MTSRSEVLSIYKRFAAMVHTHPSKITLKTKKPIMGLPSIPGHKPLTRASWRLARSVPVLHLLLHHHDYSELVHDSNTKNEVSFCLSLVQAKPIDSNFWRGIMRVKNNFIQLVRYVLRKMN